MRKKDDESLPRHKTSLSAGFSGSTKAFDDLFSELDKLPSGELQVAEARGFTAMAEGTHDPKIALLYDKISKEKDVLCGDFSTYNDLLDHAVPSDEKSGYIDFNFRDPVSSHVSTQKFGWKLAISLGHEPKDNIEKAYNLIKDILIDNKVCSAKVACKEYISQMPQDQQGKEMRIYPYANPLNTNWEKIITEISVGLSKNNIQPGHCAPGDRQIVGSPYVTYRNDAEPGSNNTRGVRPKDVGYDYNPSKAPDPFAGINVNLSAQQQVRALSNVEISTPAAPPAPPKFGH